MPRKKTAKRRRAKSRTVATASAPDSALADMPTRGEYVEMEEATATASESLFDDMAVDAYVTVRRRDPKTKQMIYLFRLAPEEATEEVIQQYAGGGAFWLRERVRDPKTGEWQHGRHRTVYIAGAPKQVVELPPSASREVERRTTTPGQPVVSASSQRVGIDDVMTAGLLKLFQSMDAAQQTQVAAIRTIAERERGQVEWGPIITAAIPLLTKLLDRPDPRGEMLEIVEKLSTLMRKESSPAQSFKDMVETMNEVLDLKDRSGGPQEDPIMYLARTSLPKLISIIEAEQKRRGGRPTPEQIREAAQRELPPGPHPVEEAEARAKPLWYRLLESRRALIMLSARRGADPVTAADYAADNLIPEEARGSLVELLSREDALHLIAAGPVSELSEYPQWAEQFFSRLAENLLPQEEKGESDGEQ